MAIAFPASPTNNLVYTDPTSGSTWIYNSTSTTWESRNSDIYDFAGGIPGVPTASQIVAQFDVARSTVLAANFAGSYWNCNVAPTAQTTFSVEVGGVSIGSIIFAANSNTATFTSVATGSTVITAGSILTIVAPATPDATLASASGTLAGYLQ